MIKKPAKSRSSLNRGDRVTVHIDRLAVGGRGVARHEGLVIFVSDVAPDETAEIELTLVKKNFAEAKLLRIVSPSPHRVQPPCPVAGVCGGCSWQHVRYDEQLRQKRELVREALRRFSGFDVSREASVEPVVPSPQEFRYRNRIQLHHDGPRMGFFKRGSHAIVDIDDCPITEEILAREIPKLKGQYAKQKAGRIELLLSENGIAVRNAQPLPTDEVDQTGDGVLAFSQVNSGQNQQLVSAVVQSFIDVLGPQFAGDIYDLYAGNGNFTFPLAAAFPQAKISSAELNPRSVASARDKAAREHADRALSIHEADVALFLRKIQPSNDSVILLDPPRVGCAPEVMQALVQARPSWIGYVSCHPVTLARDLSALREAGYELAFVRPFDMFPQTDHIETWVLLRQHSGDSPLV